MGNRLVYNGLKGTLGGSGLTSSATSVTFAAKLTSTAGDVPTIAGGDYIPLEILDSSGNLSEVVWLTAYTAAATTGTIARGKEGTTGAAHSSGDKFLHGPSAGDAGAAVQEAVSTMPAVFTSSARFSSIAGTWVSDDTQMYNSTHALNDACAFYFWLGPGTYTLEVVGKQNQNRGIQTWEVELNDGTFQSIGTMDYYHSSSQLVQLKALSFTLASTQSYRRRRVRLRMASTTSTDYYGQMTGVSIIQTAA